jgi:hypothetical protein
MLMDAWGVLRRRLGLRSLSLGLLGRWVAHAARGHLRHEDIARAAPVRGELLLGWLAHYCIGVAFAALLLAICGVQWARDPSLLPALALGVVTVAAPLFVLQPAMGAGVAFSRSGRPIFNSAISVVTHAIYGAGLYLTASATAHVTLGTAS